MIRDYRTTLLITTDGVQTTVIDMGISSGIRWIVITYYQPTVYSPVQEMLLYVIRQYVNS